MTTAIRLGREQSDDTFLCLLVGAALLSAPAVRLSVDGLRFAIAKSRPAVASAPAPAVDPWAAAPFVLRTASIAERKQAVNCLAAAVYFEAGAEPLAGQRAVAQVVLNRLRDPKFPASVCGVVFQGARRHTGCQFSFVCDGSFRRRPPGGRQLAHARNIATQALYGRVAPEVGTATHYHANYVHPSWGRRLVKVNHIGAHIFYRRPGEAGAPSALTERYAGGELSVAGAVAVRALNTDA
jgi:spore germination cell wall hydrolase CwlJ-like protein